MNKPLRIFVSSPGDVPDERLRVGLLIDKLAREYRRYFNIEATRWEHEPLIASGHFQDAIDPPSQADIVILILWSRLGTPLPERTALREYRGIDGRTPVTGTEWEYEDALKAARERGAPDLLVFRNMRQAPVDTRDAQARLRSIEQLDALDAFWRRHFADQGVFLAAYDQYETLEEFASRLENTLRKLIEKRIQTLPREDSGAATWLKAPFRGLQAYAVEHAPIYFGRDEAVARAAVQLAANAREGKAFLLISGASGSGKSSLAQAGMLPRLMRPQCIEGTAFLRHLVFRPGGGADPVLGLVRALTRGQGEDGIGLPELLAPGQSAEQLAAYLRSAPDAPGFIFGSVLARLTEAAHKDGRLLAFEQAKLILIVDQLEELFTTAAITPEDRAVFARLLAGLARSGAVWVIATQRSDFWHRAADIPELAELAQGDGRFDLSAPTPAELAEMIRKPAQAAGLAFASNEDGRSLDAVIADAAAEARRGVLPLLSFLLEALYEQDVAQNKGSVLTFATYESLGGLEGAISKRAEDTVRNLNDAAQQALPRVLRALVTMSEGGADEGGVSESGEQGEGRKQGGGQPVARLTPLERFAPGSPARTVVDAFIEARLIVASEQNVTPMVRLAHETLITQWEQARDQLKIDRRDLGTRTLVEQQYKRWKDAPGAQKANLLLRDPDLANAVDLVKRWGDEIDGAISAFVAASRSRARRRQTLVATAAVVFAVVAVTATVLGIVAHRAQQRAERTLQAVTEISYNFVFDVAMKYRDEQGVPVALVNSIFEQTIALQESLSQSGSMSPAFRESQAIILSTSVPTLLKMGNTQGALSAAQRAVQINQELAASGYSGVVLLDNLGHSFSTLGDVQWAQGQKKAARQSYQDALDVWKPLFGSDPAKHPKLDDYRADALNKIGRFYADEKQFAEAVKMYKQARAIRQSLVYRDPKNTLNREGLQNILIRLGDSLRALDALDEALENYQAALNFSDGLVKLDAQNLDWRHRHATALGRIGGVLQAQSKFGDALRFYQDAYENMHRLVLARPENATYLNDRAWYLQRIDEVRKAQRGQQKR